MNTLRKLLSYLLILTIVTAQALLITPSSVKAAEQNMVTVSIAGDDGIILQDTAVSIQEGDSAYDVLNKIASENDIDVQYSGSDDKGYYITSIENLAGTDDFKWFWAFYVNNNPADVGISDYNVKSGEHLQFNYSTTSNMVISEKNGNKILEKEYIFTPAGTTAFDLLRAVTEREGIAIEYEVDPTYGAFISSIDNIVPSGDDYWSFLVNEQSASVGISSYEIKPNDKLGFKIVTPVPGASIKIIGKNNEEILHLPWIEMPEERTALQLLQEVTTSNGIELITADTDWGKMITSINNIAMEGNSYWAFYVNDSFASEGAETYKVSNGDQLVFQYETYTPPSDGETDKQEDQPINFTELNASQNAAFKFLSGDKLDVWSIISLAKSGEELPKEFITSIRSLVKENGGNFSKITDVEKYVLAILAYGENPSNVEGINLLEKIYNGDVAKQGTNGVAYALIALNAANAQIPEDAKWTKNSLVENLLGSQNEDGGWALIPGYPSDIDITSMVITALSQSKDINPEISEVLDKGTNFLVSQYQNGKVTNSNSAAQIIIAFSSANIDASNIFNNTQSSIDYLLSFQNDNGGFSYKLGEASDVKATADALLALTSYKLFKENKYLYSFVDYQPKISNGTTSVSEDKVENELPNTATGTFNLLLFGLLLIIFAVIIGIYQQRKRV